MLDQSNKTVGLLVRLQWYSRRGIAIEEYLLLDVGQRGGLLVRRTQHLYSIRPPVSARTPYGEFRR